MQRKSKRIGTRRRNLIIGIGLLFSCGLLAQLAPDRTVQTEALAPRVVVPTFTSTPSIMETPTAPTKTTPPSRLLIATDTSLPLPTDTPTAMPAPSRVIAADKSSGGMAFTCTGGCSEPPAGSNCVIKGNVNTGSGENIYHVPNGQFYDRTDIKTEEGDRWFCTPEEAVAAGFRASSR
ncbi:MAG TPA: hypothetical protein PKA43_00060 [Candidatus Competibacter phosphatis]|nr:hypothetical protein [Candidatus Competibacter phosphatis]